MEIQSATRTPSHGHVAYKQLVRARTLSTAVVLVRQVYFISWAASDAESYRLGADFLDSCGARTRVRAVVFTYAECYFPNSIVTYAKLFDDDNIIITSHY